MPYIKIPLFDCEGEWRVVPWKAYAQCAGGCIIYISILAYHLQASRLLKLRAIGEGDVLRLGNIHYLESHHPHFRHADIASAVGAHRDLYTTGALLVIPLITL